MNNPSNPPGRGYQRPAEQLWFEQPRRDPRSRCVSNDETGYPVGGGLRAAWAAYRAEPWHWKAIYVCGIAGAALTVWSVLGMVGWL